MGTVSLPSTDSIEITQIEMILVCFPRDLILFGGHSDLQSLSEIPIIIVMLFRLQGLKVEVDLSLVRFPVNLERI